MTFLETRKLRKVYNSNNSEIVALDDISLDFEVGEFVSIIGPSGSGKTTLLLMLAGIIRKSSGQIIREGKEIPNLVNYGIAFQNPVLLPWRTNIHNILLPIEFLNKRKEDYLEKARGLFKMVGLSGFEESYPWQLSGGMQQRTALCRALITEPEILLLDEPFGALDLLTREELDLELLRVWRETRKSILLVTHSISEAVLLSDKVLVLSPRPGRIVESIRIDLPRPRNIDMLNSQRAGRYMSDIRETLTSSRKAT